LLYPGYVYYPENLKKVVLALLSALCLFPVSSVAISLSDYVADTLSAHPSVYQQVHIFRQVVSDRDIAESGWLPSVDLQASTGSYDSDSPLLTAPREYDSSQAELSVTQNLFNGFDTTHQLEQVEARIQSAIFQIYDTADNIALEAVQAYLEMLKQQKPYELANEAVIDITKNILKSNS
jgi:adhesin transport system outer membrane protein